MSGAKNAMYERKKAFVEGALCECLNEIDPHIDNVSYTVVNGEEVVKINYPTGTKAVIVTNCSPSGIVKQVIKVVN